jgi:Sulfotransferase domain
MFTSLQRNYTAFKKRNSKLRRSASPGLVKGIKNAETGWRYLRNQFIAVSHRSSSVNIYHWCLQKTGSVWIKTILSDPVVYKYSGMHIVHYQGQIRESQRDPLTNVSIPFPEHRIVTPMKGSVDNYLNDIPKNEGINKAFFVMRDPRDMLVSWYFSTKNNHVVKKGSNLEKHRRVLLELSLTEGLKYSTDVFQRKDKFNIGAEWRELAKIDPHVYFIKFEDLVSKDATRQFAELFEFLDIKIPEVKLDKLVMDYSFKSLTGREAGEEQTNSHMRSGNKGDWKKYFSEEVTEYFKIRCNSLEDQDYYW